MDQHREVLRMKKWLVILVGLILVACTISPGVSPTSGEDIVAQTPAPNPSGVPTPLLLPPSATLVSTAEPLPSATTIPFIVTSPTPTLPPQPPAYPLAGVEIHSASQVSLAAEAGASWVRINALLWSDVEAQEGVYNWAAVEKLDQELRQAAERGLRVILILRSTPTWAQGTPGVFCGPVRDDKLEAMAAFLRQAVARYSVAPYHVKYWEFGNEPDVDPSLVVPDSVFGCMGDASDDFYGGGRYARMLAVITPAVKSVDPEAQVLVGGLLLNCNPIQPPLNKEGQPQDCKPSLFLEGILRNQGGDYLDGVSFHAYDYYGGELGYYSNKGWAASWQTTGPAFIPRARYLNDLLRRFGYNDKRLFVTESAVLCGRDHGEPLCQADAFLATKTAYVAQALTAAQAEGLDALIWYSLSGWRASGLVDAQAVPNQAYTAFQFNAQMLRGAAFDRRIVEFDGVRGYAFRRDGRQVWVLWSLDGQEHRLMLEQNPAALYDVLGGSQGLQDGLLVVTLSPIYLEW